MRNKQIYCCSLVKRWVKNIEKLTETFSKIKSYYFPRWDVKNQWRVSLFKNKFLSGYCDFPKKTIWISTRKFENSINRGYINGIYVLLIHEITHAVVREPRSTDHGVKFRMRLQQAANKAKLLGYTDLANDLELDINQCISLGDY